MEERHKLKSKNINLQTRLYLIAAFILLLGLGSALFIYLTAENDFEAISGYEVFAPEDSKKYIHDLELYGGKANVLANKFMQWFVELWHGKSLAFTVACITTFISFWFFFVARHLPSGLKPEDKDENKMN